MFGEGTRFIRLAEDHEFKPFDCEDSDLNEFLLEDSKAYLQEHLAVVYLVENDQDTIAFFSVANDRISVEDFSTNSQYNKFKKSTFASAKHFKSYPAVKIGRFGVDKNYSRSGLGSKLMNYIKYWFIDNNKTGCRFITVDAYNKPEALNFYKKNKFSFLTDTDVGQKTRAMYFDLMRFTT